MKAPYAVEPGMKVYDFGKLMMLPMKVKERKMMILIC